LADPSQRACAFSGPTFEGFAENDLITSTERADARMARRGLRRSMLNFIEGGGLSMDVREWFDHPTPPSSRFIPVDEPRSPEAPQ
jgi:hypothetical protein